MNILIVDDEAPAVRGILQSMDFGHLGFQNVYTAYSVQEAIEVFLSHRVHVLLTDIEMQDGTGFDLIERLNAKKCRYVSIILSGFPNFSYAQRAITLGVTEYLLKPVTNEVLSTTLRKAAGRFAQDVQSLDEDPAQSDDLIDRARVHLRQPLHGNFEK